MPLIKPNAGEKRPKFMSRCMMDDKMRSEFPDNSQRLAVCSTQFAGKDESMDLDSSLDISKPVIHHSLSMYLDGAFRNECFDILTTKI